MDYLIEVIFDYNITREAFERLLRDRYFKDQEVHVNTHTIMGDGTPSSKWEVVTYYVDGQHIATFQKDRGQIYEKVET